MWNTYNQTLDRWYRNAAKGDVLATQMLAGLFGLSMTGPTGNSQFISNALTGASQFVDDVKEKVSDIFNPMR